MSQGPKKAETTAEETEAKALASVQERAAAVGLTVEQLLELRARLLEQQADPDFHPLTPEAINHAVLVFMQQVTAALDLRPCEVEACTGLGHQHQRKLRPAPDGRGEAHLTVHTLARWSNGLHLKLIPLRGDMLRSLLSLMLMTSLIGA